MTDTTAQTGVDTAPAPSAQPEAKAPEKKVPSTREAVEKAAREVEAREATGTTETEKALRVLKGEPEDPPPPKEKKAEPKPKAEAKPEPKEAEPKAKAKEPAEPEQKGPQRGPDGKFQSAEPKEQEAKEARPEGSETGEDEDDERAPPRRFSKQAQAEWENAPEAVRHEVRRMQRELEQGLSEHQDRSRRMQEIEPYEQLAHQYGLGGIKGVLADYEGMARMMAQNPIAVFETLAHRHGFSLQQVAAKVLEQDIDEYAQKAGRQITALTKQVQSLQAEVNQYRGEKQRTVEQTVEKFQRDHPRYAELESTIKWILKTNDSIDRSDPAKALKEAYDMAERLKPAAVETSFPQPAATATRQDMSAQTAIAAKSPTGAPGKGSNPANRKPSANPRESVLAAARRTGLV